MSISRFFSLYYITNALVPCSYLMLRAYLPPSPSLDVASMFLGVRKEIELSLIVLLIIVKKSLKASSIDSIISTTFLFGKTLVLVLLWFRDWRLMVWYVFLYAVLFLLIRRPAYTGPEATVHLNDTTFSSIVKSKNTTTGDPKPSWLILFHATWHAGCADVEPIFAELSLQYSSMHLKFGKVNVKWEKVAHEYGIDISGTSSHLPTLIIFEQGEEVGRLPPRKPDGQIVKTVLSCASITKVFELERRSLGISCKKWLEKQTLSRKIKKGKKKLKMK